MKMQAFPNPRPTPADVATGGLALLAMASASEIWEGASEAQAQAFYAAVGKRMAALEPLEGVSDASVLYARISAFWQALDWGEIELEVGEEAITVRHRDLPVEIAPDPGGHWRRALLSLLEGAYDGWFRALGSGPALHTVAAWKGDVVELRHGR